MKFKYLLFLLINCLAGCQEKTPIDKVIVDIESSWSEQQIDEFSQKKEENALADIHFSYGMYFRNNELRNPKDSTLLKYFNSLNVYHLDDMSGIVFTSLHRRLNNKPIGLEEQLKEIHSYWKKMKVREDKNTKRAIKYYSKYKKGDSIIIRMPLREGGYATRHSYPEDSGWVYNDSLDLLIKGVIKEKSVLKDTFDMFFKLKILSMNHDDVKFLMDEVNIGDIIESDFRLDIIEDVKN